MNPALKPLFKRRSIRRFTDQAIGDECIRDLLAAAMAAPSAVAKDPWSFIVVHSAETRAAIAALLPNGAMLAKAPVGIIVCGDSDAAHGGELSYLLQDCSAAIENLLVAASILGLGACWLGVHPRQDRIDGIRDILSIPERVIPVSAIALGHPAEDKPARTRFRDEAVHYECW